MKWFGHLLVILLIHDPQSGQYQPLYSKKQQSFHDSAMCNMEGSQGFKNRISILKKAIEKMAATVQRLRQVVSHLNRKCESPIFSPGIGGTSHHGKEKGWQA